MKAFFVFIIVSVFLFIVSFVGAKFYLDYSNVIISISLVLQFVFLSILYFNIIKNKKIKKLIVLGAVFYVFFWLYNFSKSSSPEYDFTPLAIECIFFIFLIVYYFFEIMRYNLDVQLFELPSFWISVAFLINFSGTFILFLFSKSLLGQGDRTFDNQFLIIVSTITIVKNILLCIALIANKNLALPKTQSPLPPDLNLDNFQSFNNRN